MQDNRRDRDYGLFHKLGLDGLECGVTLRRPVVVSVGMDRNFDKNQGRSLAMRLLVASHTQGRQPSNIRGSRPDK